MEKAHATNWARGLTAAAALALCGAAPAAAQDPLEALRRMESMEAAIQRLTAQVERLEFDARTAQREADARLQDLEFRVIELEGGDPMAALRAAPEAQSSAPPSAPAGAATPTAPGPAPLGTLRGAIPPEERAAFEAARRDLETLGPGAGRDSFAAFLSDYPQTPLAGEAQNLLGAAYAREGRHQEAARSFLIGVRDHGQTPKAAENLLGLARALTDLGRQTEACSALGELAARFPDAAPTTQAQAVAEARRAGCS